MCAVGYCCLNVFCICWWSYRNELLVVGVEIHATVYHILLKKNFVTMFSDCSGLFQYC